ncbi:hypothetical protein Cni_G11457 [Canna indica]|uniref:Uncharacterized protein n=1 Tax=Canna indica TaxID=4628 RepID=A0AAQ3K8T0_9LILI|nr:hypothetical protein Cni_G11457 [Canna indica]
MLRNLIWATSKHDVYTVQNYSVTHWSSLLRRGKEVLNVAGKVIPTQSMDQPGVAFSTKLNDDGEITNAVDIAQSSSGSIQVVTAGNDCYVRVIDAETFVQLNHLPFGWSVNLFRSVAWLVQNNRPMLSSYNPPYYLNQTLLSIN